nr:DUF4358 domain-containing protein [uncultured Gemmiger sp.]
MKKLIAVLCAAVLMTSLLAACTGSSSSAASTDSTADTSSSSSETATDSAAVDEDTAATAEADTAKLESIVSAIEAVNEVPNARELDDFALENEIGLTMDNIVGFKGDVTNDQADCALVLAVQAKSGSADAVKTELEAYKESASSNLYAEFADKVAKAQDARIVVSGDFVVMVISGINGPDYADIDAAIDSALA